MDLTPYERKAIGEFISANAEHRSPKDIVRDCRASITSLFQSICIEKYQLSPGSADFTHPQAYVISHSFFGIKDSRSNKVEYHPGLKKIYDQFHIITNNRNQSDYSPDNAEEAEAQQCKLALRIVLQWYLNSYKKFQLNNISNLDTGEKNLVKDLFVSKVKKTERSIVEREDYYVVLLIDNSASMLWPFLEDESNYDKPECKDYKNAILRVQIAMEQAHSKSLSALRGSCVCKEGYLKIFQHTFNERRRRLNDPEELSQSGSDKVVKVNSDNYYPEGKTALYDSIAKTLSTVYEEYLKKAMLQFKRIDKVSIGVITDGEDTVLKGEQKVSKIAEIRQHLDMLRGNVDEGKCFLVSSVLIGLTSNDFPEKKLKEIKQELNFDAAVSIDQSDEYSLRQAFKLFSTNAINV